MLTSVLQGPGYEGTITRFPRLICHLYPQAPFRTQYLYRILLYLAIIFHVLAEHDG